MGHNKTQVFCVEKTQVTSDENETSKALASCPVLADPTPVHIDELVFAISHCHAAPLLSKSAKNPQHSASSESFEVSADLAARCIQFHVISWREAFSSFTFRR